MMFVLTERNEAPKVGTVVKVGDRFTMVIATEEEIFRAALGDAEFDKRVREALVRDEKVEKKYGPLWYNTRPPRWWEFWK